MTPWDAVGNFFAALIEQKKLQRWFGLLITFGFSATVAFLSASGTALLAKSPWPLAIGYGMLSAAASLVFLWVRSPLTKNLMVAVPKAVLDSDQMASDLATVGGNVIKNK